VQSLNGVWISAAGRSLDAPQDKTENTDQELIAAINRGDESAFEVLYWRYRDWVVNLAYRFTGDAELALDVMQETFLYFTKKFPGFKLTAQLKTFLYPAVRNLSIAARRQKDRFHSPNEPADLDELPATAPDEHAGDLLKAVLSGLTGEHREILLLRFVDGLSLGELSAALQIPLGTVKSRLHNALEKLRQDPHTKNFFDA
jgi:RNA polymerase sigma-70 factor, ECF subfamily